MRTWELYGSTSELHDLSGGGGVADDDDSTHDCVRSMGGMWRAIDERHGREGGKRRDARRAGLMMRIDMRKEPTFHAEVEKPP